MTPKQRRDLKWASVLDDIAKGRSAYGDQLRRKVRRTEERKREQYRRAKS